MSSLYFVRHGQASLGADDYDNLSTLGVEQARLLAKSFVDRGMRFDAVYAGPKRRHQQTANEIVTTAMKLGLDIPDPVEVDALTEIDAHLLGDEAMKRVLPSCPNLKEQLAGGSLDDAAKTALHHYSGVFEALMKRWANGEFEDRLDPYAEFSRRVITGVQKIMREQGRKRRVLVVTSGGPISMITRLALGAAPDKAVELMFALNTASITELRYTENRLSLVRFNDAGYLPSAMLTGI